MTDVRALPPQNHREWFDYVASRGQSHFSWRSDNLGSLEMGLCHHPRGDHPDPAIDAYVLALVRAGSGFAAIDIGSGAEKFDLSPGHFGLARMQTPTDIVLDCPVSLTFCPFSQSQVERALGLRSIEPIDFGRSHSPRSRSGLVDQLMRTLWHELAGPASNPLFIETYIDALIVAAYQHGHGEPPGALKRQSAAKHDFAKLTAYIGDNLAEPLTLESLASVMDVTTMQLAKAFRAQQGLPLHRYVLQQRVTRARELIADPKLTLSDVAYATGFSSQAHMTSTFSKMLGTTPGRLRQAALT